MCLMLTNQEPDWNIDDISDAQIYAAIRYLEPESRNAGGQDADGQDRGNGVVICVGLCVALSLCLAFLWFYWR